jgi:hypothetical protein
MPTIDERFDAKTRRNELTGCLEWTGAHSTGTSRYGQFTAEGRRQVGAHRWAWERANRRKIPKGMVVRHMCDNPSCVEPLHLLLGTYRDNTHDMMSRRRDRRPLKLTDEQVAIIRDRHVGGIGGNTKALAAEFGVTVAWVCEIAAGRVRVS